MPSIVGTTTSVQSFQRPHRRLSFYANGRFWVWYSDGTNLVFRTSTDGLAWSSSTTVRALSDGRMFAIHLDGTYVHYAVIDTTIRYRRGTPNSDGSISWSAGEQNTGTAVIDGISIDVDSSAYPYISYRSSSRPYITKSSANNGTWSTAGGYPFLLKDIGTYWNTIILSLTNNRMYVIYNQGQNIYGKLYNGTSWGSEETATTDTTMDVWPLSATPDADNNVHLVWTEETTYHIKYKKRTFSSGTWGDLATVQSSTSWGRGVISIDSSTLYVFWIGSPTTDHVYYKKCVAGAWDPSPTDWITDSNIDPLWLSCFYAVYGGYIGFVYLTGTASPYNVKFDYLSLITYKVEGVTRDSEGSPLGSCAVWLFLTSDKSYVDGTTSNATTGAYSFTGLSDAGPYFIRSYKDGSPNVFGTTDDDIAGVEE